MDSSAAMNTVPIVAHLPWAEILGGVAAVVATMPAWRLVQMLMVGWWRR